MSGRETIARKSSDPTASRYGKFGLTALVSDTNLTILRKKSLLPFLQIRLIYAVNGTNKLYKPTNQNRRRRARRRSGRSHSATAEGEGEALRRLEGDPPAPIDLSITRTLSLFLAMPRHHSVPLALSHYYSVPRALFRSLLLSLTITRSLTLFF